MWICYVAGSNKKLNIYGLTMSFCCPTLPQSEPGGGAVSIVRVNIHYAIADVYMVYAGKVADSWEGFLGFWGKMIEVFSEFGWSHWPWNLPWGALPETSRRRATRRVTRMSSSLSLVKVSQTSRRRAWLDLWLLSVMMMWCIDVVENWGGRSRCLLLGLQDHTGKAIWNFWRLGPIFFVQFVWQVQFIRVLCIYKVESSSWNSSRGKRSNLCRCA